MAGKEGILLTVSDLLIAVKGSVFGHSDFAIAGIRAQSGFSSVTTDSKTVCSGSLFVPLIGETQDGHSYVEQATQKGATVILVQESSLAEYSSLYENLLARPSLGDYIIIVVKSTLRALQSAASAYVRKFPNLKKIAITGSSGKTTAKECVASVLAQRYKVIMNEGNLNSETGLPLSVFAIRKEHEIGLFEMGMNRQGEIKELADVLFPQTALITNIGTAHIGILGTQVAIAEEKKQIFSNFTINSTGFIFEDDNYIDFLTKDVAGSIRTYGFKTTEGIEALKDRGIDGSDIIYDEEVIHFPLPGFYNAQNAFAAICLGQYFDLSASEIRNGLEAVKPLFGRSQIIKGTPSIIQDCYNANYESMCAAIDFISTLDWPAKKILVLGDMLELGEKSDAVHDNIVKLAFSSDAAVLFFIGEALSDASKRIGGCDTKKVFCSKQIDDNSLEHVIGEGKSLIAPKDLVLLKGSRGIQLERAVSLIQAIAQNSQGIL